MSTPRTWTLVVVAPSEGQRTMGRRTGAVVSGPELEGEWGDYVKVIELEPVLEAFHEIHLRGYHPSVKHDVEALLRSHGRDPEDPA